MIALFAKAVRAAIRQLDQESESEPAVEQQRDPAQDVIDAQVSWAASTNVPNTYEATWLGERWQLRVDQSNQGTRFILLRNGQYVREEAVLPRGWTVPR